MEEKTKILSPVLKVRQQYGGQWKVWWPGGTWRYAWEAVTLASRVEGPAIIYQDGRVIWVKP